MFLAAMGEEDWCTMGVKEFDPIHQLDAVNRAMRKRVTFTAKSEAEAKAWQRRARLALAETLGFLDQKKVSLAPKTIERVDRGSYVRHKVILRTSPASLMPMYVLIPKIARKKLPCVLALHGHGYGV